MQTNRSFSDTRPAPSSRSGFSLLELGVVILILALLATLASTRLHGVIDETMTTVAEADMAVLRDAFLGGADGAPGLIADLEGIPGFSAAYLRPANLLAPTNLVGSGDFWIVDGEGRRGERARFASDRGAYNTAFPGAYADAYVFTNRDDVAGRGWNGPYLTRARTGEFPSNTNETASASGFFPREADNKGWHTYGIPGEPAVLDPWGNPYVLQVPPAEAFHDPGKTSESERFRYARLVSAGPDRVLQSPCHATGDNTRNRDCRLAGRRESSRKTRETRGDDIVLFLLRADIYED